jgi:cytochrome c
MPAPVRLALIGFAMLTAAWTLIPQASAAGDPAEGAKAFGVCAACHSLRPDLNMTGPSLAGIWGRTSGGLAGFDRYSPALRASRLIWEASSLDAWLTNPAQFIPDNWMTFAGIPDAQTRADLIAFLRGISERRNGAPALQVPSAYIQTPKNLKQLAPDEQVKAIRSCRDSYFVTTADGRTRAFWDQSLHFETDAGSFGPTSSAPALLPAGMLGDRGAVIFSEPAEISSFVRHEC